MRLHTSSSIRLSNLYFHPHASFSDAECKSDFTAYLFITHCIYSLPIIHYLGLLVRGAAAAVAGRPAAPADEVNCSRPEVRLQPEVAAEVTSEVTAEVAAVLGPGVRVRPGGGGCGRGCHPRGDWVQHPPRRHQGAGGLPAAERWGQCPCLGQSICGVSTIKTAPLETYFYLQI